jgi:hypothetical protein
LSALQISPRSMITFFPKQGKLPKSLMKKLQSLGAEVDFPSPAIIDFAFNSSAYMVWKEFCSSEQDVEIYATTGTIVQLPEEKAMPVYIEAIKLLSVYSQLTSDDFESESEALVPQMPADVETALKNRVGAVFVFRRAGPSLHNLFERICFGVECPAISSLDKGMEVIQILLKMHGACVVVRIHKS